MKSTARAILANSQHRDTRLSPAEREAKLLGFKRGGSHNFALNRTPSKPVVMDGSRFATA